MSERQSSNSGLWTRIKLAITQFMEGRYGTDQLNSLILWVGLIFCIASMLVPAQLLNLLLATLAYVCMGIAIFRSFSRNTYKRYWENRRYLSFISRVKDRDHKYFQCPSCRQSVRVPKGKGNISITCPKCREKFVRKS